MHFKTIKDLEVSALGFGCWAIGGTWNNTEDTTSIKALQKAVELGINFFDVAPVYGLGHAETLLGQALTTFKREKVVIATKCGLVWNNLEKQVKNDLTKASIIWEVDETLKRLQTDYVDILQCHWPDPNTSLEETAEGLNAVLKSGKVRHLGVSNFSAEMTRELAKHCELVTYQGLYNVLEQNPTHYHNIPLGYRSRDEIMPLCKQMGMKYLPYSPLMQGVLTGTFLPEGNFDKKDDRANNPKLNPPLLEKFLGCTAELQSLAKEAGMSVSDLALGWLMAQEAMGPVIAGAYLAQHIEENISSVEREYSEDLLKQADAIVAQWDLP